MAKTFQETAWEGAEGASITQVVSVKWNIKKDLFSVVELQGAINCMQNGKLCGLNDIPTEGWQSTTKSQSADGLRAVYTCTQKR